MRVTTGRTTKPCGARRMVVLNVAVPTKPPAAREAKRSKVEILKEKSDFLRHPLMEELVSSEPSINEEAMQLMKFHGSYMQDHREKRAFGQGKFYQFMMRTRQPGGQVTNQLYLAMDDLADKVRAVPGGGAPRQQVVWRGRAWAAMRSYHAQHPPLGASGDDPAMTHPSPPPPAVWQRHPAPDHAPGVPAARRAEGGPEDGVQHGHQKHGVHAGRVRRRQPQRHGPRG